MNELLKFMEDEEGDDYQVLEEMQVEKIDKCPRCNCLLPLDSYVYYSETKSRGKIPVYHCLKCGFRGRIKVLGFHMKHNEQTINLFISLRKKGISLAEISRTFIKVNRSTLTNWNKKFVTPKKE